VNFDVTLTFDGRQRRDVVVKTVSSESSLDVEFTPTDFGGQFGSVVFIFAIICPNVVLKTLYSVTKFVTVTYLICHR